MQGPLLGNCNGYEGLQGTRGIGLTIRDGSGTIIGTTEADVEGEFVPSGNNSCTVRYDYSVNVPREDFYQVEVQGSLV